jgi:hypothetical protein
MDIYLTVDPDVRTIQLVLGDELPVMFIADWQAVIDQKDDAHLVLKTENDSEFPFGLSLTLACEDPEGWLLDAARILSVKLSCRTLYTGSPLADCGPYDCVVFELGKAYLASDLETRLAGDGDGQVRLVRRLPEFDAAVLSGD